MTYIFLRLIDKKDIQGVTNMFNRPYKGNKYGTELLKVLISCLKHEDSKFNIDLNDPKIIELVSKTDNTKFPIPQNGSYESSYLSSAHISIKELFYKLHYINYYYPQVYERLYELTSRFAQDAAPTFVFTREHRVSMKKQRASSFKN